MPLQVELWYRSEMKALYALYPEGIGVCRILTRNVLPFFFYSIDQTLLF